MISKIARFFLFTVMKWKVVGHFPKDLKKYVIIGAPHTSNYDFVIGLLVKLSLKEPINFIGKKSLFVFPLKYFFKAAGGIPVNRKKNQKMVDAIVATFNEREQFIIAISPEGTRKKVTEWKTGFYYVSKNAKVPVVALTFDFGKRQTEIFPPFYPTDSIENDIDFLKSRYEGVEGKVKINGVNL